MFKGKIKVFDEDGNLTKEYDNAFVLTGRYFALEALFPMLRSGSTWLDEISTSINTRYFEAGESTVVNGNDGPAELGGSVSAANWGNGSMYDYDIGSTIQDVGTYKTRYPVTVLRRDGRTITIEFELNKTYFTIGKEDVYEVGIFLGDGGDLSTTRYPQYSPDDASWGSNDRKHGLIARILFVKYNSATDQWDADPINTATPQTVQYEMRMI